MLDSFVEAEEAFHVFATLVPQILLYQLIVIVKLVYVEVAIVTE